MPTEVIKTKSKQPKPRIYGVTIHQEGNGAYAISVRHAGQFRLKDYDVLEFEFMCRIKIAPGLRRPHGHELLDTSIVPFKNNGGVPYG